MTNEDICEELKTLRDFALEKFDFDNLDSFWLCESAFTKFLSEFDPTRILNTLLKQVCERPSYPLPSMFSTKLILSLNEKFSITLDNQLPSRKHIYSHPFVGMAGVFGKKPIKYDVYSLPKDWNNQVFDANIRLRLIGEKTANPGEIIRFDGRTEVVDMKLDEPTLIIKFFSNFSAPLEWSFYRDTLKPLLVVASDVMTSRNEYMVKVLGELGNAESIPVLLKQAKSHAHYVRWSAIQAICRLDGDAGIDLLKAAVDDPHPHVRSAAVSALTKFGISQ